MKTNVYAKDMKTEEICSFSFGNIVQDMMVLEDKKFKEDVIIDYYNQTGKLLGHPILVGIEGGKK